MEKVTVAVTNYNGARHLPHCLAAVRNLDYADIEVMLVDNASTDHSLKYVRSNYPEVRILETGRNLGPGPARNLALRQARTDLVFSIDNDAVVAPDCLSILVGAIRTEPGIAACQPRSLDAFEPTRIHYDGAYLHYLGLLSLRNFRALAENCDTGCVPIDSLVAVAILYDRRRLRGCDLFDEDFFFYFEEQDLSHRLRLRGCRFLMIPEAVVHHREGTKGLSHRSGGEMTARRAYFYTRNRWFLILKNYELRSLVLLAPALLLYEVVWMLFLVTKGRTRMYLTGILDLMGAGRALCRKRAAVQKSRRLRDRELFFGESLTFSVPDIGKPAQAIAVGLLDRAFRLYWKLVRNLL